MFSTMILDFNKMELLQSQAPVDRELSGSSASARHGTFDIKLTSMWFGPKSTIRYFEEFSWRGGGCRGEVPPTLLCQVGT